MTPGRRLAFVDLELDEFHANTYLDAFRGELAGRGWTVTACHALHAESGRAWARDKKIPWAGDIDTLRDAADGILVLAPSNPEVHLELCRKVFPLGKPTYVDKTFAPDLATARAIFDLADRHGVAVQTSSALRYTAVQAWVREHGGQGAVRHMVAWGGGSSFEEYAIHPVELVVSCMGPDAERLSRRGGDVDSQLLVDFSGGRTAVINVYAGTETDFAAAVTTAQETRYLPVDGDRLFLDTAAGLLDFFDRGAALVERRESLAIRALLDAAGDPAARGGFIPVDRSQAA